MQEIRTAGKENELKNRAVIVGIFAQDGEEECDRSLDELERLLDTAGAETFARLTQSRDTPDSKTCLGSGKLTELKELCTVNEVNLVVFDMEMTPAQIRNVEEKIDCADVIDRSMLILDIFAQHATSGEGRLQVDLAQLKYTAPRLIGKGKEMSRLGAGIRTRGPGESKLEIDRRRIKTKAAVLEEELKKLDRNRMTMRNARDRSGIAKAAIVGYTNAGKSTLLNRLTDAGILAEDKLFATLDPTTRKYTLPGGSEILLTDTVGFIRKLPHHLIQAFKSTLDEAVYADILIVLADASDPECAPQLEVTRELLTELGASEKPTLYVFNKCDKGISPELLPVIRRNGNENIVTLSALTGEGIDEFSAKLEELVRKGKSKQFFLIPNAEQSALNVLYRYAEVISTEWRDDGVCAEAVVDARVKGMLSEYLYFPQLSAAGANSDGESDA